VDVLCLPSCFGGREAPGAQEKKGEAGRRDRLFAAEPLIDRQQRDPLKNQFDLRSRPTD